MTTMATLFVILALGVTALFLLFIGAFYLTLMDYLIHFERDE
jgi:hypothetical protein